MPIKDIILAIDDTPERYVYFAKKMQKHGLAVVVLQNQLAAEILLDTGRVRAVFLDHDMPSLKEFGSFHPGLGLAEYTLEMNGQFFAREVLGVRNVPVAISSAN